MSEQVKICPKCGLECSLYSTKCSRCMSNLKNVSVLDTGGEEYLRVKEGFKKIDEMYSEREANIQESIFFTEVEEKRCEPPQNLKELGESEIYLFILNSLFYLLVGSGVVGGFFVVCFASSQFLADNYYGYYTNADIIALNIVLGIFLGFSLFMYYIGTCFGKEKVTKTSYKKILTLLATWMLIIGIVIIPSLFLMMLQAAPTDSIDNIASTLIFIIILVVLTVPFISGVYFGATYKHLTYYKSFPNNKVSKLYRIHRISFVVVIILLYVIMNLILVYTRSPDNQGGFQYSTNAAMVQQFVGGSFLFIAGIVTIALIISYFIASNSMSHYKKRYADYTDIKINNRHLDPIRVKLKTYYVGVDGEGQYHFATFFSEKTPNKFLELDESTQYTFASVYVEQNK